MTRNYRFASSWLALFAVLALAQTSALAQRIVIDPGHGGSDPGGTGTGMQEKEVVLDTGLRFRDLLQADTDDDRGGGSWTVNMTRDTDTYVSLAARSSYANSINADRFMSIHANAFGDVSANGTETFSYSATGTSAELRNLVQEEMVSAWGLTNRGNKTAGFSVLVNTAMPAELHELAFITNATDATRLASSASRQDAAMAHLRALQRHYGLEAYAPGVPDTDPESGSLLIAVRSESSAALAGVTVSLGGSDHGQTDEAGELLIEDLELGAHLVTVSAPGFHDAEQSVDVLADDVASVLFELVAIPEDEDATGGGGSANCDSQQGECKPPAYGVDGGCSTQGRGSGMALALLLLALMSHASRRSAAGRCSAR